MTVFSYKCRNCGHKWDATSRALTNCPACLSNNIGRDFSSVRIGSNTFQPHFNHAVGAYVSSSREFDDMLKIRGEEAGSDYTRIDPGDMPRPTKDDHIFDTQAKTIRDRNINPADLI